jgi:ubiquinone/menaquinone biosynthesis C-methylase UbiE
MKPTIPSYVQDVYYWAYVNPRNVKWLDREIVVRTILWQQHNRLQQLAFDDIAPGENVLQVACVYGKFCQNLAEHIGPKGSLDAFDVAEIQVINTRKKLENYPNATVYHGDILNSDIKDNHYDTILCYFLLHEVPEKEKAEAVDLFMSKVKPGGKVIFVDYDKPRWWHPLKLITSIVFDTLEPFAKGLWRTPILDYMSDKVFVDKLAAYQKTNIFGNLFQKVLFYRRKR